MALPARLYTTVMLWLFSCLSTPRLPVMFLLASHEYADVSDLETHDEVDHSISLPPLARKRREIFVECPQTALGAVPKPARVTSVAV
jgi:hypothetical protein